MFGRRPYSHVGAHATGEFGLQPNVFYGFDFLGVAPGYGDYGLRPTAGCNRFTVKRWAVNANWPIHGTDSATTTGSDLPGFHLPRSEPSARDDFRARCKSSCGRREDDISERDS